MSERSEASSDASSLWRCREFYQLVGSPDTGTRWTHASSAASSLVCGPRPLPFLPFAGASTGTWWRILEDCQVRLVCELLRRT